MPMLKRLIGAAVAACLALPVAAQAQTTDVKFILDFISLGRHAPWYVALGKGYFKDEGLNVTIMPSKGTADAIRTVVTGGAEIGFIDVPSLVAAGGAGAPIRIVAANYQKPPYCIFSLNPGKSRTVFLPEIPVEGLNGEDVAALKEKVFKIMEESLLHYKASWASKTVAH